MGVTLGAGLALAAVAWALLFGRETAGLGFWARAAVAGPAIGLYALVAQRGRLGVLAGGSPADVAIGGAGAIGLYGVFRAGNLVLRRRLPALAAQVDDLYARRVGSPGGRLPVPLVLVVVGACEELFWRGLVQARAGFVVALAGYAVVHLWERRAVLVLAAVAAGAFWGALFAWRGNLVAPVMSHALWDLAVVVWLPLAGPAAPLGPET